MFYLGWNGWMWLNTTFSLQQPMWFGAVIALLSYSYILGRMLRAVSFLSIIGSIWFAIVQYGLIVLPLANITVWVLASFGVSRHAAIVWVGYLTLILLIGIFIVGLYNAYSPVIRKYEITIPKKAAVKKLRIAVASDMHFGKLSGTAHLKRLVKTVEKIKPDLILLPGDIIDDEPRHFTKKNMGSIMKDLKAPLGVYGVLGNHEYYGREIPAFLKEMENIHIKILMDEVIKIEDSFYLLGRKDRTDSHRQTFEKLVENLDSSIPLIAMDHQPAELYEAQEAGIDLILSGHTHRGQMSPNHLITRRIFELDWGYLQKEQLHAVVSSGFGFWGPPLRIGSRSEVVEVTVHFQ
jgi:predicted MPP superfamily phosphohydrolase